MSLKSLENGTISTTTKNIYDAAGIIPSMHVPPGYQSTEESLCKTTVYIIQEAGD